jgi:hypothetical protein
MSLYLATRELHHACEQHPLGQRMSAGTISAQEWADWLMAFRAIHGAIDPHLPALLARVALLDADLAAMRAMFGVAARLPAPAERFAQGISDAAGEGEFTPPAVLGAAYVLHGAHRRGGQVLARLMGGIGYASAHVIYPMPAAAEAFVKGLRDAEHLASHARATFAALLAVMDDIMKVDGSAPSW